MSEGLYSNHGLSSLYPADVEYGLLEASPGGCACCSSELDFRRRGGRLISASEASTSGRTITTHALASAPAEPIEGPEALKAYVNRRIELFEQFKLRESEAVRLPQVIVKSREWSNASETHKSPHTCLGQQ